MPLSRLALVPVAEVQWQAPEHLNDSTSTSLVGQRNVRTFSMERMRTSTNLGRLLHYPVQFDRNPREFALTEDVHGLRQEAPGPSYRTAASDRRSFQQ
jgi:hypothetical protein